MNDFSNVQICPAIVLLVLSQFGTVARAIADPGIENVVVRGERVLNAVDMERRLTPGGVSVVDFTEIQDRNLSNLADALRYVPGLWSASSSGAGTAYYSMRGSNLDATNYDANGVKLLVDGLPVTTADGNNHNRSIDPLAMRAGIIARGANALKYGASTLGGAMDFVSPTAKNTEPMQLYLNWGAFGQMHGRATLGGEVGEAFDGMLTVERKRRDGYRDHSESDLEALYANVGWQAADGVETRLYLTYHDYEEELPGGLTADEARTMPRAANPATATGNFQFDVVTRRIANKTTLALGKTSSLSFGLSREVQELFHPIVDVRVDFDGPGPMAPTQVFSLLIDTEQTTDGAMVRYENQAGSHNLIVGLNWGQTNNEGGNYTHDFGVPTGLSTIVNNTSMSIELFAMDRWLVNDRLTLTYGLQAVQANREVSNITGTTLRNPRADYDSINPRAGFLFSLREDITLFGNLSSLYEAPTNYELEDDARGNEATLAAMDGSVFEVGVRGARAFGGGSSLDWDVALYYASINNEILSRDDPNAPGTSLTINVDDTIHAGIEALVGGSFVLGNGRLEPRASITVNEFSFDDDPLYGDNALPAAPGYVVRGEVIYRTNNGFFAGPTFDIVDQRYADFANTYEVGSYNLWGFRTGIGRSNWQAFLEIKNLADKDYISTFSVVNAYSTPSRIFNTGEPRAVYAGVQFNL
ncbi:MAG: TonB-dependent receptor family protein [Pseudomonadota bacterium]